MSAKHRPGEHLWAVCRLDTFQLDTLRADPEQALTVVRVVDSEAEADLERARLQAINPAPDARYFVQITRRNTTSSSPPVPGDLLAELQRWFREQCDGDWEHDKGIEIQTLDNPGWSVKINLAGTDLQARTFATVESLEPRTNWHRCWVENSVFNGVGGPNELGRLLRTFLEWASARLNGRAHR